jgi:hypothetical protein
MAKRRREQLAERTMEKKEWLLSLAYPELGSKRVAEIKPIEVLRVLQEVENRGCYETARRLRSTIGAVCRFAVATARAEADPTSALRGALTTPKVVPRAAISIQRAQTHRDSRRQGSVRKVISKGAVLSRCKK